MGDGPTRLRGRGRRGGRVRVHRPPPLTAQQQANLARRMRTGKLRELGAYAGVLLLGGAAILGGVGVGVVALAVVGGALAGMTGGSVVAGVVNAIERKHEDVVARTMADMVKNGIADAQAPMPKPSLADVCHAAAFNGRVCAGAHSVAPVKEPVANAQAPPKRSY